MLVICVKLDEIDSADASQSNFSIIVQASHAERPDTDEYVHDVDGKLPDGREMQFARLAVDEVLGGIRFYAQAERYDDAVDRRVREPIATQYLPLALFCNPQPRAFKVPLLSLMDTDGRILIKGTMAIRVRENDELCRKLAFSLDAYRQRVDQLQTRCETINRKTIDYFLGKTGFHASDERAARDVCILESGAFPVKNMPVNAFLQSRFHPVPAWAEDAGEALAFENMLQVELDARCQSREWFQSTLAEARVLSTGAAYATNAAASAGRALVDVDQICIAVETAMAALTTVTRIFTYESDTARFARGLKVDGDSYDVSLINESGDCDDLGIAIVMIAHHLKTRVWHQRPLMDAWVRAISYYEVDPAFGGVTSAAFTDSPSASHDGESEYGNHFWAMAVRKTTSPKFLPHTYVLDGTGHVHPSLVPLPARIRVQSYRAQMFTDHVGDTRLLQTIQRDFAASTKGIAMGPVSPFDLTAETALEQSTAAFYRQPVGFVKRTRDGICVFGVDGRSVYSVPIRDVMEEWHRKSLTLRSIHRPILTDADMRMFDEDARMRVYAPPFCVSRDAIELAARLQVHFRNDIAAAMRSDAPLSPKTHSTMRCTMRADKWPLFKASLLDKLMRSMRVYVRVYPLRNAFYRHENGEPLLLVQAVLGLDRSDPSFVAQEKEIAANWKSTYFF